MIYVLQSCWFSLIWRTLHVWILDWAGQSETLEEYVKYNTKHMVIIWYTSISPCSRDSDVESFFGHHTVCMLFNMNTVQSIILSCVKKKHKCTQSQRRHTGVSKNTFLKVYSCFCDLFVWCYCICTVSGLCCDSKVRRSEYFFAAQNCNWNQVKFLLLKHV